MQPVVLSSQTSPTSVPPFLYNNIPCFLTAKIFQSILILICIFHLERNSDREDRERKRECKRERERER